jgi:hypothetical protein
LHHLVSGQSRVLSIQSWYSHHQASPIAPSLMQVRVLFGLSIVIACLDLSILPVASVKPP